MSKKYTFCFIFALIACINQNVSLAQLQCPENEPFACVGSLCAKSIDGCNELFCPKEKPFYCKDGSCVTSATSCSTITTTVECPASHFICPDGSCVENKDFCKTTTSICPEEVPVLCSDGSCAHSAEFCNISTTSCPSELPVLCTDGSCVHSAEFCPQELSCPSGFPILCPEGFCVTSKEECTHHTTPICPEDSPILCTDGSCVSDFTFCSDKEDFSLKDLVKEAIGELNSARRSFSRSSRVARPISREFLPLIKDVKNILNNGNESCEDDINDVFDKMDDLTTEIEDNICEEDISEERSKNRTSASLKCIPEDAGFDFIDSIDSFIGTVESSFDVDDDSDLVPDICQ